MEIPNYQTLKTLPSGSTISLFNDKKKIYNVADGEIQTKILKPQNTDLTWNDLIEDDKTYWFTMVTKDEYNSMLDSNNVISEFPGTMRDHNGWQQLIFVPTVEEAITMAAFHMSERHMPFSDNNIIMAFCPESFNLAYHHGQKRVNNFQRGQSVQFLQVLSPHSYKMSQVEMDNLLIKEVEYNPCKKFSQYTWRTGWTWFFGHPLHVTTLLGQWKDLDSDKKNSYIHHALICMALQHLGLEATSHLPLETQDLVQQFRIFNRLEVQFVDRPIVGQRGHIGHRQWIEEQEKIKNADKDEEGKIENSKDDPMDGTKKRKTT